MNGGNAKAAPQQWELRLVSGQNRLFPGNVRSPCIAPVRAFRSKGRSGLRVAVRRADHERPLCGEVEGSDVLKELPKFSLGSYAHGSIRVQEGQPTTLQPLQSAF